MVEVEGVVYPEGGLTHQFNFNSTGRFQLLVLRPMASGILKNRMFLNWCKIFWNQATIEEKES